MNRTSLSADLGACCSADEFAVAPSQCSGSGVHPDSMSDNEQAQEDVTDAVKASDHAADVFQDKFVYVPARSGVGGAPELQAGDRQSDEKGITSAHSGLDEFALPHLSTGLNANTGCHV